MEYTQNYQLPLWDKEDAVKRTDFNENNQKIDAALAATSGELIVTGTYTGQESGSSAEMQTIILGFQPRFLFVRDTSYAGSASNGNNWTPLQIGFVTPEHPLLVNGGYTVLTITEDGFIAGGFNTVFNRSGVTYAYLAIK